MSSLLDHFHIVSNNRIQRLRALFLVAVLLMLFGSHVAYAADMIVLKNGQRIAGKIDPNADVGPDQIAINTGNGILRLPKDAIAIEDLSFEARKARLAKDDLNGLVALAMWCRSKGMAAEALELLEKAIRHKEVTLATRAVHARLVDEIKGPEKALELYRRYRKDGGDDPLTISRLDQLEAAIAAYEKQKDSVSAAPPAPKIATSLQAGLESKGWNNEALQWSNPVRPQIINITTEAGIIPALKIDFKGGDKDKATIKRSARLTIGQDSVLTFMAQNSGKKPLSIAIAVKTGSKYIFHESPQQLINNSEDFQKLRFDLKAANFKSAASNWENNTPIADLNDVKEIQLLIYNGKQDGTLVISSMGFPSSPDL